MKYKLDHESTCVHSPQDKKPIADFYLFEHLWHLGLIDALDLEELLVGKHCIAKPPLTRSRWASDSKDRREWESHKELSEHHTLLESGASSLPRPKLAPLDEYCRSSCDASEDDFERPTGGVVAAVEEHIAKSQGRCRTWRTTHAYCGKTRAKT
jgi:hypothetical protein